MKVRIEGKNFATDAGRFTFRGVTYGTFRPRLDDGARFPRRAVLERDFAAIREAGFTVVRTYTPPTDDLLEVAGEAELSLLSDVFYPDWRYLVGSSSRSFRQVAREARAAVSNDARRLAGCEQILALSLGNEIPADVIRWVGTKQIAAIIEELADAVREADADRLVTYANYPTAEYLPLETLDFLSFNVFLETQHDFRRYLTRLHHLAGDRPLVLTEMGLDAMPGSDGEAHQAATLDWQLETALERAVAGTCIFSWTDEWWVGNNAVEGWQFGLVRADRSPRPALDVARRWNQRTVADLDFGWPSISVVVCAHNAEETLRECLDHCLALDYPGLEVLVVDDGSTDGTTSIARSYNGKVRLVEIDHAGLAVARNEGLRAARGDMIAYLDSDAFPPPEWPYYLALGFDGPTVAGVGGPNLVPADDRPGAQRVAHAPGGPVHVLMSDDRAEHVPGCNMAFWRTRLEDIGGFDPVYVAAGDDVDLCWKVLDRGWEIGFHPGAMVWHRRRAGLRAYLKQQRGYGQAEALVEARHPDRFTPAGTARWRGHIYTSFSPRVSLQRVYRGEFGTAAFQSVYRGGGYAMDLAHQLGVPAAAALLPLTPLAFWHEIFGFIALAAALFLVALYLIDVARADSPRGVDNRLRFRAGVAVLHLLQPLARVWGRTRHRPVASQTLSPNGRLPGPVQRTGRSTLLLPADRPRGEVAACAIREFRRAGMRATPASEWADYDARLHGSTLVAGRLVTSSHPVGCIQLRVRRRLRLAPLLAAVAVLIVLAAVEPLLAGSFLLLVAADTARGVWRTGAFTRRTITKAAIDDVSAEPRSFSGKSVEAFDA